MAGISRIALVVFMFLAAAVSSVQAFGRSGMLSAPARTSSYLAVPTYYYYCWPAPTPTVVPVPDAYPRNARPTAAPPSATSEPPLAGSRVPKIIARAPDGAKDRCRVGFWNLASHDLSITIEGKSYSLPKNQVLTFDMDRQFTWQVAGKTPQIQRVPEGSPAFEVLIRE